MPASRNGRHFDAKATPQHNGTFKLPPEDRPIPKDQRNVVPCICCPKVQEWYVLTTVPQGERRAAESLKREGYTTYVPCETFWRKGGPGKGDREMQRPIFRGYVFVSLEPWQSWYAIREKNAWGQNKHGLIAVLSVDGRPYRLTMSAGGGPLHDLMNIAAREAAGLEDSGVLSRCLSGEVPFNVGDRVEINEGAFATYGGEVTEVDASKMRMTVEVSIFGRATPVALDFGQVDNKTRRSSRIEPFAKSA